MSFYANIFFTVGSTSILLTPFQDITLCLCVCTCTHFQFKREIFLKKKKVYKTLLMCVCETVEWFSKTFKSILLHLSYHLLLQLLLVCFFFADSDGKIWAVNKPEKSNGNSGSWVRWSGMVLSFWVVILEERDWRKKGKNIYFLQEVL